MHTDILTIILFVPYDLFECVDAPKHEMTLSADIKFWMSYGIESNANIFARLRRRILSLRKKGHCTRGKMSQSNFFVSGFAQHGL
jgi:hypothetical protein